MSGLKRLAFALPAILPLCACQGWQSALDPAGPQADRIFGLIVGFTALLTAIWIAVMIVLAVAVRHSRRELGPPLEIATERERRLDRVILTLALCTGAIVLGLTGWS